VPFGQDRLGNNTEGATLITAGPFAGQVAVLDGYDVIAVRVTGAAAGASKLFDIRALLPEGNPSGITYIPAAREFVFDIQGQWDSLWVTDERGAPRDPRPVTYLPGFDPGSIASAEGMTHLPHGSPLPDRIARAIYIATSTAAWAQIEVLTVEGVVEQEIKLGPPLAEAYVLGIAFLPPDGFLVSTDAAELWTIGLDGQVRSGPVTAPGLPMVEALVRLENGRVFAAAYSAGKLTALDATLARDPTVDRQFTIGPGLSRAITGVWDPVTECYLLLGMDRGLSDVLAAVPPSRAVADVLFPTSVPHMSIARLPDEDAFALGRAFAPHGVDIVGRDGAIREQIEVSAIAGLPNRRVSALAYLPATRQFAMIMRKHPNTLWLVSRAGVLDGSFKIPAPGLLQAIGEDGQDRLRIWAPPNLRTVDLAGNVLASTQPSIEGLVNPWGYVAGPNGQAMLLDAYDGTALLHDG
jgi:hypothetical protein